MRWLGANAASRRPMFYRVLDIENISVSISAHLALRNYEPEPWHKECVLLTDVVSALRRKCDLD